MNIVPVIFEDHNLVRLRPLTWSLPVFEVRCGMFNTRERVGLCTGVAGGILLGRHMLRGLGRASQWEWGTGSLHAFEKKDCRFLWLTGMLVPDSRLISGLLDLAKESPDFIWRNEQGLVAALVDGPVAVRLAEDWQSWEKACEKNGDWTDPGHTPRAWAVDNLLDGGTTFHLDDAGTVEIGSEAADGAPDLVAKLGELAKLQAVAPGWIWEIVGCTSGALTADLASVGDGRPFRREPFGIFPLPDNPAPVWLKETSLKALAARYTNDQIARLAVEDPERVFCGEAVDLAPGTALDTKQGPIILDRGVRVMPHCYLEGPLYIGPGSLVKPGARLHGESSFGLVNRLAGEIGESTFGDFANKQHEGFVGHAVLGSWINLGAMTTCSDLKNNYGEIRVDLGSGPVATGNKFIGLMMGDHAKSAIGTLFNTGSCVGFASNIFGTGMPPKFVGNFQWGGQEGCPLYAVDRARTTAEVVMARRGCRFTGAHSDLFTSLGS